MMSRLVTTVALLALYLALTNNLELANVVVGALVAVLITFLLPLKSRPITWRRLAVASWAMLIYVAVLAIDVVKNGVDLGRIILDPRLPIEPGIVAIPSCCQSELATALSAHAITVSPGELVVGIDADGVMYTHTLDVSAEAQNARTADTRQRELLGRIFP
jgi:multicomponent Na+:H+ antiporter subunit E